MPRRKLRISGKSLVLDARPDRVDLRDRRYTPPLGALPPQWPREDRAKKLLPAYVKAGLIRDQGEEGACTGFGLAAVIDYLVFIDALHARERGEAAPAKTRRASTAMLYDLARIYDEWPGEDYEGSSCRGALKGWHRHGVCREDLWKQGGRPQEVANRADTDRNWDLDALQCTIGVYYRIDARSIVDMQAAIHETGAIYCAATVHDGWSVDANGPFKSYATIARIKHVARAKDPGGHAFALVGYTEEGFIVQNSWGTDWGTGGFALLPYAEWVARGDDAWVFTLGVPSGRTLHEGKARRPARSPRFLVPVEDQGGTDRVQRAVGLVAGSDSFELRYGDVPSDQPQPLDGEAAYRHTLVLDRGFLVRNDITCSNAEEAAKRVCLDLPSAWLKKKAKKKLMIYVHGGLNSEAASIARTRAVAPYALDADIWPLFIAWRSGPLETIEDIVQDLCAKLGLTAGGAPRLATSFVDRFTEKTDRLLEPALRGPGTALWEQMKLNAARASKPAGGVRALVGHLARLKSEHPGLEVHLIGHSAGSIVIGEMLPLFAAAGLTVKTLRLFAPACTIELALDNYLPAVKAGVLDPKHWHIHNLADAIERNDSVIGAYRKSLLYLVSRSFEDVHETALLGMDRVFDPKSIKEDMWSSEQAQLVARWQKAWAALGVDKKNRFDNVLNEGAVRSGPGHTIRSSHGCFDNATEIMGQALGYIVNPAKPARVAIDRLAY